MKRPWLPRVAYFCMEFGIAGFLKLYSGGLGILAGDHLKAASDLDLPLCAVGLAYHDGYFRQMIDREGRQEDLGDNNDFGSPPFKPVMAGQYSPLKVTVPLPTGPVQVGAWQLDVGHVPEKENEAAEQVLHLFLDVFHGAHRLR